MEKLFLTILNMSLTASIIVLVAMIIRVFLRKVPRWISCMLWGIVAFRLVCPFSLNSKDLYIRRYGLTKKQKNILGQFNVTESYINKLAQKMNERI